MPDILASRLGLTNRQSAALVMMGAALWFLAAIILRIVAPLGALEGSARAITYALIVPGTLPLIVLTRILVKLRNDQIAIGMSVVTATALLIDGIVVAWFPIIYGGALPQVTNCAAAIIWGAGVGLVVSFILNRGHEI